MIRFSMRSLFVCVCILGLATAARAQSESRPVDTDFTVSPPVVPPPTPERVRAGAEVERPQVLHKVVPKYPALAVRAQLECSVILEAVIGKQGEVIDVEVVRGCSLGLNESALAAVQQWQYHPATQNGRPVEVYFTVFVEFKLH